MTLPKRWQLISRPADIITAQPTICHCQIMLMICVKQIEPRKRHKSRRPRFVLTEDSLTKLVSARCLTFNRRRHSISALQVYYPSFSFLFERRRSSTTYSLHLISSRPALRHLPCSLTFLFPTSILLTELPTNRQLPYSHSPQRSSRHGAVQQFTTRRQSSPMERTLRRWPRQRLC